jgi:hypothetical protein
VGGAVSGTVSDAGGTHHGLANVTVGVYSQSGGGTNATTGADGTFTARGLPAGTDYQVCFYSSGATGGSSDATGYLDQCFDNQPMSGTPTPVTVSLGATRVGADAALVGGAVISGTVSEAGGTQHGLANVWVEVSSPSTGAYQYAFTAADGSYTVSGLAAATDYTVSFHGSGATGGSSDSLGYVDQWFDNQPTSATAMPVTVTSGASLGGVNAALTAFGAISGMVSEAGGTHAGLANVQVQVLSPDYGSNGSNGSYGYATTAADGSYTVTGLAAGTEYRVCFFASGATGGFSDALGYLDQCYDNQPTSGTPTLVTVTAGATTAAVDAALDAAP